jgi:hypothetical protein
MWGVSKGTKKTKEDTRLSKNLQKKKLRTTKYLGWFTWLSKNVGISLTDKRSQDLSYKIARSRIRVSVLNREIRPAELSGLIKLLMVIGCFVGATLFVLTGSFFSLIFIVFLFAPSLFDIYATGRIESEDEKLEIEFPDFYLMLHNRLTLGADARISPSVQSYLISLKELRDLSPSKQVIKNFVSDLQNNIEIYGDESIAVMKLREKYRSVMVINFTNLAVQALSGVDNRDNLLQFKVELTHKKRAQLQVRADKMVKRGSRAVMFVYVILFQFILLSWIAKLSVAGGIGKIFGF